MGLRRLRRNVSGCQVAKLVDWPPVLDLRFIHLPKESTSSHHLDGVHLHTSQHKVRTNEELRFRWPRAKEALHTQARKRHPLHLRHSTCRCAGMSTRCGESVDEHFRGHTVRDCYHPSSEGWSLFKWIYHCVSMAQAYIQSC